jgi:hypothetical protein
MVEISLRAGLSRAAYPHKQVLLRIMVNKQGTIVLMTVGVPVKLLKLGEQPGFPASRWPSQTKISNNRASPQTLFRIEPLSMRM